MSRRALLLFLPFAVAAMVIAGIATAGTGDPEITVTPSHESGWYQAPITLSWTVTGDPEFEFGCEDSAIGESGIRPYTCTAQHTTGQPTTETVNIGVDLTDPTFPDPPDIGPLIGTSPAGRTVSYGLPGAFDNLSIPTVTCSPASGSLFPVGTTTVNCTATDASDRSTSASFTVTIIPPNTPPSIDVSGPATVEATGPGGGRLSYTVAASDPEDGAPNVHCDKPVGASIAVGGSLTVTCTATDSDGATDQDSLTQRAVDTTPPHVTVPASMTVPATGQSIAVSFNASASDLVSGSLPATCTPASGSEFTIAGSPHRVTCTATDAAGNTGSDSFSVSVQDAGAPVVNVPASITVEANGPSGAVVNYAAVTATDPGSGTLPATCFPPSGATIPLGTWLVECTATDTSGNVGKASFAVRVVDTTPPVLTIPANLAIQSTGPVAATDTRIKAFLGGATATDIVDTNPAVTTNAPSSFPVGVTTVTFTARDDAGNTIQKEATVTVSPDPPGQPGGDTTPPKNVGSVRAILGNLAVSLSWKPPASDFDHVDVVQSPGSGGGEKVVYSGKKKSFVARGLTNGVEYRFVIIAYDKAGNRASGVAVVALAQQQTLLAPPNGAVLATAPLVKWKAVKGAKYYNAQIWYEARGAGRAVLASAAVRKVMSVWPTKASFKMKKSWRFGGKKFTLRQGRYLVYIWPGIGLKSANRYGKLLVQAEFTISRS